MLLNGTTPVARSQPLVHRRQGRGQHGRKMTSEAAGADPASALRRYPSKPRSAAGSSPLRRSRRSARTCSPIRPAATSREAQAAGTAEGRQEADEADRPVDSRRRSVRGIALRHEEERRVRPTSDGSPKGSQMRPHGPAGAEPAVDRDVASSRSRCGRCRSGRDFSPWGARRPTTSERPLLAERTQCTAGDDDDAYRAVQRRRELAESRPG